MRVADDLIQFLVERGLPESDARRHAERFAPALDRAIENARLERACADMLWKIGADATAELLGVHRVTVYRNNRRLLRKMRAAATAS